VDAVGTNTYTYWPGGFVHADDGPFDNDTVSYTNNNARLRQSLTLQQASGVWTQSYAYDASKRLTNTTSSAGAFVYTYQAAGKLVRKLSLPNKSYITNVYDNVARLTGTYLTHSNGTVLNKHEYLYNAGNQRIRHTRTDNSYVTNTYDNIGQLKTAVGSGGQSTENLGYNYDAAWNLNQRTNSGSPYTFSVDSKNQLTSDPSYTDGYDDNGNLTTRSNGTYLAYTYSYDDENQLKSVAYGDGSQPTTAWWRLDFVYDGRDRLRRRLQYSWNSSGTNVGWVLSQELQYIYDGNLVIQDRVSGFAPTASYARGVDMSGTLEGAGGMGGLLERATGYPSWNTHYYYQADGNGNITALEDGSQNLITGYRYDPFGNTLYAPAVGPGSANPFRFSSKQLFYQTGLYYYGYRFYDPNLQRWLNRDPMEEQGFETLRGAGSSRSSEEDIEHATVNEYLFVNNMVGNFVDIDGRTWWKPWTWKKPKKPKWAPPWHLTPTCTISPSGPPDWLDPEHKLRVIGGGFSIKF